MTTVASIIDIVSNKELNVKASVDEVREHAKYIIENGMSALSEDDLVNDYLTRGVTKMHIQAIEVAHKSGASSD